MPRDRGRALAGRLRSAFQALGELSALSDPGELPQRAAQLLRVVIPCELASWTHVDPVRGSAFVAADPPETLFDGGAELFARDAHEHPVVSHFARTGDRSALALSDFVTRRELHATGLYAEVYRRLGVEYQLAVSAPAPPSASAVIGLTVSRHGRDFCAADRELLALLAPQVTATFERLRERALIDATLAARRAAHRDQVVLVADDGTIVGCDGATALTVGEPLPGELHGVLAAGPGRRSVSLAGERLAACVLSETRTGVRALVLERSTPTTGELAALGLTPRQAEVLALLAQGHSSASIAHRLDISVRTVEKHLESIYARLGVSGRGRAIAFALGH